MFKNDLLKGKVTTKMLLLPQQLTNYWLTVEAATNGGVNIG